MNDLDKNFQNIQRMSNQTRYDMSRSMDMLHSKIEPPKPKQPKRVPWYKRALPWLFKGLAAGIGTLVLGTIYTLLLEPIVKSFVSSLFQ